MFLAHQIFFLEPHEQQLVDEISIQGFIYKIFAQTGTLSVCSNQAWFLRFWAIFQTSYLQNKFGDLPIFFTVLACVIHNLKLVKVSEKKSMSEKIFTRMSLRWLNTVFMHTLVLMWDSAHTMIAKKQTWHQESNHLFFLYLFHMCFFLLTITHAVVGFSRLL